MKRKDIHILVVDDDKAMCESIVRSLEKKGYRCSMVHNGNDALQVAKIKNIHAFIVDCMLPKINGVELVGKVKELGIDDAPFYLISGIFKDRGFIKDSIKKTGAKEFFLKPLEVDRILSALDRDLVNIVEIPKLPLHSFLGKPMAKKRDRIKALEKIEHIQGYDLPFIINIFMDGESSGHLNVFSEDGDIFGISFSDGRIVKVDTGKTVEVLQNILLERKYIEKNQLEDYWALERRGDLIKNLIEENYLSPHLYPEIKIQQMIKELFYIVSGEKMQMNFVPIAIDSSEVSIEPNFIPHLFADIVENKIPGNWLENFYASWSSAALKARDSEITKAPEFMSKLVKSVEGWNHILESGSPLKVCLEEQVGTQHAFLKAIHLLAIRGLILFEELDKKVDTTQTDRLKFTLSQLKDMNPFEIFQYFGTSKSCRPDEVEKIYRDFAKSNHPDKFANVAEEQKKLRHDLFALVTNAFNILIDSDQRSAYEKDVKTEDAHKQMKAESLLNHALQQIQVGHYQQAMDLAIQSQELCELPLQTLYILWAKLKIVGKSIPDEIVDQVSLQLSQFSDEMKESKEYLFVAGLYNKAAGDPVTAKTYFDKALQKDSRFLEARRELNSMLKVQKKSDSILSKDLGEVIGSLFKKKK